MSLSLQFECLGAGGIGLILEGFSGYTRLGLKLWPVQAQDYYLEITLRLLLYG